MTRVLSVVAAGCSLLLLSVSADAATSERRVALVVGNSAYEHAGRLLNPVNDALAVAALLKNAGFNVFEGRNDLTNLAFKRTLREFEDAVDDADVVVVYYAGHGIEVNRRNWLVPVDAKLAREGDVEDEAISLDRITDMLESVKTLRLVILDACRDNPLARAMKVSPGRTRSITGGLASVEPGGNVLIAFAAKAGSTADDGQGVNSPFTTALLKYLTEPGLDVGMAFRKIRDDVLKSTGNKQEPFLYGSLGGREFPLVPKVEVVANPPPVVLDPLAEARRDFELARQLATKEAWESFLIHYPNGFHADLARSQLATLVAAERARVEREHAEREEASRVQLAKLEEEEERQRLARELAEKEKIATVERLARERDDRERAKGAAPPTAAPGPPLDEAVWNLVKDSKETDELRRFIQQFPQSSRRADAEQRVAALTAVAPQAAKPQPAGGLLVEEIKTELKRVGCYVGPIDGKWTPSQIESSVRKFVLATHASTTPDELTIEFLNTLRGTSGRVCPPQKNPGKAEKPLRRVEEKKAPPMRKAARNARWPQEVGSGGQGPRAICLQPALCGGR